jgi:hypothetical protein
MASLGRGGGFKFRVAYPEPDLDDIQLLDPDPYSINGRHLDVKIINF